MLIEIEDLEVWCHIGVSSVERACPQKILISVTYPVPLPEKDKIESTVDYAKVAESVRQEVCKHPRELIETLARDVCENLKSSFGITPSKIRIKKFVLPSTSAVVLEYCPL